MRVSSSAGFSMALPIQCGTRVSKLRGLSRAESKVLVAEQEPDVSVHHPEPLVPLVGAGARRSPPRCGWVDHFERLDASGASGQWHEGHAVARPRAQVDARVAGLRRCDQVVERDVVCSRQRQQLLQPRRRGAETHPCPPHPGPTTFAVVWTRSWTSTGRFCAATWMAPRPRPVVRDHEGRHHRLDLLSAPRRVPGLAARAMAGLGLEDVVTGRGSRTVWALCLQMLRELAQHSGHADILREQILAARSG